MKTARDLLFLRVNIIYSLYFLSAVTGKQKVYIARQKDKAEGPYPCTHVSLQLRVGLKQLGYNVMLQGKTGMEINIGFV